MKSSFIILCGATGSGKTRILQQIEQQSRDGQVLRIGAEVMIEDILDDARSKRTGKQFENHYREIDTLLIDNLWVLASRPRVSSVIRKMLKDRISGGRLTVVASDLSLEQWQLRQPETAGLFARGAQIDAEKNDLTLNPLSF
jgi:chromosomal replication initiation ATPase DnaA